MDYLKPNNLFLTKGVGKHKEKLASFEMALRRADIAGFNLVKVSSIFPPGCKVIPKKRALNLLSSGQIVFTIYAENTTNEPHRLISASVGLAIPTDTTRFGYLSEHHGFGQTDEQAGEYAEDLAATLLATILGVEFSPELSYDERRKIWQISGQIVKTTNITQSARGDKSGFWTTVIAAAVFVP